MRIAVIPKCKVTEVELRALVVLDVLLLLLLRDL